MLDAHTYRKKEDEEGGTVFQNILGETKLE